MPRPYATRVTTRGYTESTWLIGDFGEGISGNLDLFLPESANSVIHKMMSDSATVGRWNAGVRSAAPSKIAIGTLCKDFLLSDAYFVSHGGDFKAIMAGYIKALKRKDKNATGKYHRTHAPSYNSPTSTPTFDATAFNTSYTADLPTSTFLPPVIDHNISQGADPNTAEAAQTLLYFSQVDENRDYKSEASESHRAQAAAALALLDEEDGQ